VSAADWSNAGQGSLDFFADARAALLAAGPQPGVAGRSIWAAAARAEHGPCLLFDEVREALGHDVWELDYTAPGRRYGNGPELTPGRCVATVMSCDTRPYDVGGMEGLVYRGGCLGCDWEGPVRDDEDPAVEDACDHAWPGWRDFPLVANPKTPKAIAKVKALYDEHSPGWSSGDAPLRSNRKGRHYWSPTFDRWDIAAGGADQ
jgi:hypothetical protein